MRPMTGPEGITEVKSRLLKAFTGWSGDFKDKVSDVRAGALKLEGLLADVERKSHLTLTFAVDRSPLLGSVPGSRRADDIGENSAPLDGSHIGKPDAGRGQTIIDSHIERAGWVTPGSKELRTYETDRGTRIPPRTWDTISHLAPEGPWYYRTPEGLKGLFYLERDLGQQLDHFEPRGKINPHFNCHGYTFSRDGAAGWLPGAKVDDILADNGFRRVADESSATPGDVVVYRAAPGDGEEAGRGVINHTGVVAQVGPDGIMVDSKLGALSIARHEIGEFDDRQGPHEIYTTDRPDGRFLTPVPGSETAAPPWPYEPGEASDGAR
ncbi:hypothetical protein ACWDT6_07845 [Nocardia grenadensis]|uniref:hypothetical protein n=1 Tax=Nocardia grenadensis TaxID=931537 RepID=UPI003D75FC7D